MKYKLSAIIEKEKKWYVAYCSELSIPSQGKTVDEAFNNLKEAVKVYLETASEEEIKEALSTSAPPIIKPLEIEVNN